jgi:imidazolonepropionase-like amidohydrolase
METRDVLLAATSSAANLFGESERGSITGGKRADLVLLDGDPLESISALRLVAAVFQNGRRVA